MPYLPRVEFLKAWFPSLADHPHPETIFQHRNAFLSITSAGKGMLLEDKLVLAATLQSYGILTPTTLLSVSRGRFFSPSLGEISQEAALGLLEGMDAFIKSRTGWGGIGAFRLYADGSIHKTDGSAMRRGLPALLGKIKGGEYLIQEVVQQDERFSAFARSSVNTVRCVTFPDKGGDIHIAAATLRMGDGRSVVDNGSSGGIVCGIDPATGRILGPGRTLSGTTYETHPSSGVRFEGTDVPDIAAIFEIARVAHRALNSPMSIGWDIALTPEGPSVIEGNGNWGARGHVLVDEDFERRTWELFMAGHKVAGSGFPQGKRRTRRFETIKATLSIRGKVQGVGYRKWVSSYAEERGVAAAATNLDDGTVLCHLVGPRWRVEFVTFACHRGPAPAVVEEIEVQRMRVV